jgi:MoxR-like ATPase
MRQVLCPVLVGREAEVQVLRDALGRAADGNGGTCFVVGEAGVGKSRLVREVSRLASSRGLPVLTRAGCLRLGAGGIPSAGRSRTG